jgi:hypothetical protein
VIERPLEGRIGRAENRPVMEEVRARNVLHRPREIGRAKRTGLLHRGQLVVVDEDDATRTNELTEIDQVDEDTVEPVIPVDGAPPRESAAARSATPRDDVRRVRRAPLPR